MTDMELMLDNKQNLYINIRNKYRKDLNERNFFFSLNILILFLYFYRVDYFVLFNFPFLKKEAVKLELKLEVKTTKIDYYLNTHCKIRVSRREKKRVRLFLHKHVNEASRCY